MFREAKLRKAKLFIALLALTASNALRCVVRPLLRVAGLIDDLLLALRSAKGAFYFGGAERVNAFCQNVINLMHSYCQTV